MLKKIIFQSLILTFVLSHKAQSAKSGGMPQLNSEFWFSQIFWLILTFGIMFIILAKLILPKISGNLETRRSQILENIEIAEKQREESENKIKEFEKIILNRKNEAKNYFNEARQKVLDDINRKKESVKNEINDDIKAAEKEIKDLKNNSREKIHKIAIETSSDLAKQLIDVDVNNSSISAIVEDISRKNKNKYHDV